jgi:hypothetical protein
MLLMRRGTDPRQRKGDPVNAISIIYVNEHLQSLRAESQRKRPMASLGEKRSLRARIAAASKNLRRAMAADEIDTTLPVLTHWPYRV